MSVLLQASGGDGIFGNGNSPLDRSISLSWPAELPSKATDILTINTSGIFSNLSTASDEYRIVLKGTGSSVIRDNSGLALDGLNLDAAGNQLPLPSGADQFPGSDFQVTFTIDTSAPSVIPGTFKLDPASDSSMGLNITNVAKPTFDGGSDHRRLPAGQLPPGAEGLHRRLDPGQRRLQPDRRGRRGYQRPGPVQDHADHADPQHAQHGRDQRHPGGPWLLAHLGPGPDCRPVWQPLQPADRPDQCRVLVRRRPSTGLQERHRQGRRSPRSARWPTPSRRPTPQ